MQLYHSTFYAYLLCLSYGFIIWGSTCKPYFYSTSFLRYETRLCETVNGQAMSEYFTRITDFLSLRSTDFFRLELATFMYKVKKKTVPMAFQSFFKKVTEGYERATRASTATFSKLFMFYCKTSKLQRSIKYLGALLWNSLSLEIHNSSFVKVFRSKYKNCLLNSY